MQYVQSAPFGVVSQTQRSPAGIFNQTQVTQTQGAPVTIVTQSQDPVASTDKFRSGTAKMMLVLSSIQVAMGIICVIFGSVLAGLANSTSWRGAYVGELGYGIWVGLFYVLVGGIGIGAAQRNTACLIVASMVLHIICSACWCATLVGLSSIGVIISSSTSRRCSYSYYDYDCNEKVSNTFIAMDSLMIIMGITEFVITIWGAVLCCGAVCRCCKPSQQIGVVHYSLGPVMQNHHTIINPSVPMSTLTTYPVIQGQQMAYPLAVHQPTSYVMQTTQPSNFMAQSGPNAVYMSQSGQPGGYSGQPSQPPHAAYFGQQAPPSQPGAPPAYQ